MTQTTAEAMRVSLAMLLSEFIEHVPNWKDYGCSRCWVEDAQDLLASTNTPPASRPLADDEYLGDGHAYDANLPPYKRQSTASSPLPAEGDAK